MPPPLSHSISSKEVFLGHAVRVNDDDPASSRKAWVSLPLPEPLAWHSGVDIVGIHAEPVSRSLFPP